MANIDNLDYVTRLLIEEKKNRREWVDEPDVDIGTTGSALYDFAGQALWNTLDQASFGTLGARDAFLEKVEPGEETWEEMLAGGAAGNWDQLSPSGKAGAIVGGMLGNLPALIPAVRIAGGSIRTGGKLLGAAKLATKMSTDDLIKAADNLPFKKGIKDVAESLKGGKASKIIDDAYNVKNDSNIINAIENNVTKDVYQDVFKSQIKENIGKTLQIADDEILEAISKETVEIVSKNNPNDAFSLLTMLGRKVPGAGPAAGAIIGAAAYDAAIGFGLGTIRVGAQIAQKKTMGVDYNEYREPEYIGNYDINIGSTYNRWWDEAVKESFYYSMMGPVSFLKGGTQASHIGRLGSLFKNSFKSYWKPLNKYTNKELRMQLTAMDELSDGYLTSQLSGKYRGKTISGGKQWFKDATSDEDTQIMREMLSEIRSKFVMQAPKYWIGEFGTDVMKSAPRMAAGIVAMNTPRLLENFYRNGASLENAKIALGGTPEEIAANIFTAAFFTRRPHSFHADIGSKGFKNVFETGNIDNYFNSKASQLRKIVGSMKTFGADAEGLNAIVNNYGNTDLENYADARNIIKSSLDNTREFFEVNEILSSISGADNMGGADLMTSFNKKIADMVKNNEITYDQALALNEKLSVAQRILEEYEANTGEVQSISFTPDQALDIVTKLAAIKFNGKTLSANNMSFELDEWMEKNITKSVNRPQEIQRDFLRNLLDELELPYDVNRYNEDGALVMPDVTNINFNDNRIRETVDVLYGMGRKNGWIVEGQQLRASEVNLGKEQIAKAQQQFIRSTESLMSHIWGDNWKKSKEFDPLALINPVWSLSYSDLLKHQQRRQAYELFTDGSEHGIKINDAESIKDAINQYLLTRGKLQVRKEGDKTENYGEVVEFLDKVQSAIKSLNPNILSKNGKVISFDEATALKEKIESATGDLFSNTNAYNDFQDYITQKAISKIGINDIPGGIDVKASLVTLMKDVGFNYQEDGVKPIFPSLGAVEKLLISAKESNSISPEMFKRLKEHYEEIVNKVELAKAPVGFDDTVLQAKDGDWIKSLQKSLATGEAAMDNWSNGKARATVDVLDKNLSQMEKDILLIENILMGADNLDTNIKDRYSKQLSELYNNKKATLNLRKTLKTALIENNPYVLRAASKKESDIRNILNMLSYNPKNSDRLEYARQIVKISTDIQSEARQIVLSEANIQDFIKEEISNYNIPEKDIQDKITKLTTAQFSTKYKISTSDLDKIFDIDRTGRIASADINKFAEDVLGDIYRLPETLKSNQQLMSQAFKAVQTLKNLSGDVALDNDNFNKLIVDPIKIRMQSEVMAMNEASRPSQAEMDSDLYSVVSGYFSKIPIKTVKIDIKNNKLHQGYKVIGETSDRGFGGIIKALDPNQDFIYLAERSGVDKNGNVIRDINGNKLLDYNTSLQSGRFKISNAKGKSELYKTDTIEEIKRTNFSQADQVERYRIIPMNESTSIVVRVDKFKGSLHDNIKEQFGKDGLMFKTLEAILDGNVTLEKHANILKKLNNIRNLSNGDDSVVEAIKLTRMILNMPGAIDKVVGVEEIDLNHKYIKNRFKRDKLNETKNGYIPTESNRAKTGVIYKNASSDLYKSVYEDIKDWVTPDANGNFRKLKTLSIDDEAILTDANGNQLGNIFSSLDRATKSLDDKLANKLIDQDTYDREIKRISEVTKSIVDGEMFVSKDFYLASLAMIGLSPKMVRTDINNKVTGFKSGGIKPTITHSVVDIDKSSSTYGRVQEWFGKTAFKYNPLLDDIMKDLKIDAITFKSANKINSIKPKAGEQYNDNNYSGVKGTDNLDQNWDSYITNRANITDPNRLVEIPLEALSLRTISKEHNPLVGANAAVHMANNSGIREWINLDQKINNLNAGIQNSYNNPYFRTGLAQKVFGARADSGDPASINSAISSVLARNGLLLEPWAIKRLNDNLIGYFMNNGNIAGGQVENGSLDVMTADMGNLDITVRSKVGDRPTVQYFGEFLPSYFAAQKKFIPSDNPATNTAHNAIIQRVSYTAENGSSRTADAYFFNVDRKKYLQVEGRYIDESGNLIDIDTRTILKGDKKANKKTYDNAIKKESDALSQKDANGDLLIDTHTTLNDANLIIKEFDKNMAIGMLNSRQPRNMMGDVVISKMAVEEVGGVKRSHVDKNSGNVSRMNHSDAIKPQDADFDFDKSFNYVAAPGRFWREAGRIGGYIEGTNNIDGKINEIFDPNIDSPNSYANTIVNLFDADPTTDMLVTEVNNAKGQFVKMHQTATYLSNMFRRNSTVLTMETNRLGPKVKTMELRLNTGAKYITTVDNIGKLAIKFIDIYDKLPSKFDASFEAITDMQTKVMFGADGIFELGYRNEKGDFIKIQSDDFNVDAPANRPIVEAVRNRLIVPLNKYLKYNQGMETDPSGQSRAASLESYNNAFVEFVKKTILPTQKWGIDPRIDMQPGLQAAKDYFANSSNPYDIAMKSMHELYQNKLNSEGGSSQARSTQDEIIEYLENGYANIPGTTATERYNKMFNMALNEFVADESKYLKIIDLKTRETALEFEIDKLKRFEKSTEPSKELESLNKKLARVQDLRIMMEESASYMMGEEFNKPPKTVPVKFSRVGDYKNYEKVPVVIINPVGKIKEVIRPGRRNVQVIGSKDKAIKNGRRFEVTNGEEQRGLRVLFEAFAGLPVIRDNNNVMKRISSYEANTYIKEKYNKIISEVIKLNDKRTAERTSIEDYVIERRQALYDNIFNNLELSDVERKAIILRMLVPNVSNNRISIRSITDNQSKKAVFDYVYTQNSLHEPIMGLLASIGSGEFKPKSGYKDFANELLDDINFLKNAHFMSAQNPNVNVDYITSNMYTEPASLDGFMTSQKYLNQDIFNKRDVQDKIQKDAARVMIDYATSGKSVDPVILYKASKVMEAANIPIDKQWGKTEYVQGKDGNLRNFGTKKVFVSEVDAINNKDMGERKGIRQDVTSMVRDKFSCYKSK